MSKSNSTPLTQDRLRDILRYDSESGLFIRRRSCGVNRANAGDIAGSIHPSGYVRIKIDKKQYSAHRVAWFYVFGKWPVSQIDHIDGNPANNRIDNLREATSSENCQNLQKSRKGTRSGLLGAFFERGKFRASITIDGKKNYLGMFATAELAHSAYLSSKRKLHPFSTI